MTAGEDAAGRTTHEDMVGRAVGEETHRTAAHEEVAGTSAGERVEPFARWPVREARVPQGTIRYRELGAGDPVVLVHGLLTNGLLWKAVAPALARDFRVIVPDWPLGSHELPLRENADLSPPGLARIIADFLAALDLDGVTLVGNDTGGAISQLVAVAHPERLGRLVLTPCDAYDNFLPPAFRPLQAFARLPGAIWVVAQALRPRRARRLPLAYGWLSKRPLDPDVSDAFLEPALRDRHIRAEVARILRGIDARHTLEAANRFPEFSKPVLIAWAPEDRFFKWRYAERLAAAFPDARLERIEDAWTFVPVDQPTRTAELIAAFARQPARPAA
jgi:pimeloyl-ACP methyl ester carboxylesterase